MPKLLWTDEYAQGRVGCYKSLHHKAIFSTFPELSHKVSSVNELKKSEIKQIDLEKFSERIQAAPQQAMFAADMIREAAAAYEAAVEEFAANLIEIPRITIQQSGEVKSGFMDFDLDTKALNYQPVSEEILIRKLREQENNIEIVTGKGRIIVDTPERLIVNELINYPEINYDEQAALRYCKYASEFTAQNSGKPWKYVLIPHKVVQVNMSFTALTEKYEVIQ